MLLAQEKNVPVSSVVIAIPNNENMEQIFGIDHTESGALAGPAVWVCPTSFIRARSIDRCSRRQFGHYLPMVTSAVMATEPVSITNRSSISTSRS